MAGRSNNNSFAKIYAHFSGLLGGLALLGLIDAIIELRGLIVGVLDVWRKVVSPLARFFFEPIFGWLGSLGFDLFLSPAMYDYATVGIILALGLPRLYVGFIRVRGEYPSALQRGAQENPVVYEIAWGLLIFAAILFVTLGWPAYLIVFATSYIIILAGQLAAKWRLRGRLSPRAGGWGIFWADVSEATNFELLYLLFGPVLWAFIILCLSYALFFAGVG